MRHLTLRVTRADLDRLKLATAAHVVNGVQQYTPALVEDIERMMEYQNCDVLLYDLYGTETNQ
jgi:hypothetical protein